MQAVGRRPDLLWERATEYRALGDLKAAASDLKQALKARPDFVIALQDLARLELTRGNTKQALRIINRALRLMADLTDLQIQFRLARQVSSDSTQSTHEVLATINGSGSWRGESTIDYARLAEAEDDPRQYGKRLGEVLFSPAIMNAPAGARGAGAAGADSPVARDGTERKRQDQHGLRWERAFVVTNGKEWPLAIAPELPVPALRPRRIR
jgi:tetratricopeptide (TPR) repeat protein